MAEHKSALKRARQSNRIKARNMVHKTKAKSAVKDARAALSARQPDKAVETLRKAVSILQKVASKGVIPKKRASRKISRLSRQVHQIVSPQSPSAT